MYILDTDHATLYQQGHPAIEKRLNTLAPDQIATTIVSYEEQISGRLAVLRRARSQAERMRAFYWLGETLQFFCRIPVLPFDESAASTFDQLATRKLRIGTQDLLIAAIVIAHQETLLTRNLRDFRQIPGLSLEDWSA